MAQQIRGQVDSKISPVLVPKIVNGKPTGGATKLFGFTRNDYVINDDGKYDASSVFFVETDKATYDSIEDSSLKTTTTTPGDLIDPGGGSTVRGEPKTKYYQAVATKKLDSRVWNATENTGAGLNYALSEWDGNKFDPGVFFNVSKEAQAAVNKAVIKETENSGIQLQDRTGFTRDTPTSNDDDPNTKLAGDSIDLTDLPNLTIKSKYTRKQFDQLLTYPEDRSPYQDSIRFSMYEYIGGRNLPRYNLTRVTSDGGGSTTDKTLSTNPLGSVSLPVQTPIADTNTVGWGQGEMNPLQAYAMYAGLTANNFGDVVGSLMDNAKILLTNDNINQNLRRGLKTYLAGEAVSMRGALPRFTGAILNPNIELLFDKPQLRGFQFQFLLAARSQKEAAIIKKIIRFFKQGMSVKETSSNIFLKSPNVFKISYLFGTNGEHPGLHKIKTCALTSCSVDYTPDGSYMTFEDGTMTAYRISLQFSELDPITEKDYQDYDKEAYNASRSRDGLEPATEAELQTPIKNDAGGIGF